MVHPGACVATVLERADLRGQTYSLIVTVAKSSLFTGLGT
jgi:hypothetical protein